jgi:hypothetical protein
MNKKKRRQMRLVLTLSVMIAAIPLSLAFFFDEGNDLPVSLGHYKERPHQDLSEGSKILPILANK